MSTGRKLSFFLPFILVLSTFHLIDAQQNKTEVSECRDKLNPEYCKLLQNNGACHGKVIQMMNFCPETCKFCKIHCRDFLPRLCPWWQHHYACITHPYIMNKYCRKSCGKCSSAAPPNLPACSLTEFGCCWDKVTPRSPDGKCPECRDQYSFCGLFIQDCYYGSNRGYMHERCPKTCRLCPRKKSVRQRNTWQHRSQNQVTK